MRRIGRCRRRMCLGALTLTVGLVAAGSAAADTADGPPYAGSSTSELCVDGGGLTGSCSIEVDADQHTGGMTGDVAVVSPNGGTRTGAVVALASSTIHAGHELSTEHPAVLYRVTVQVHRATARRTGGGVSTGALGLRLRISHDSCASDRCVVSGPTAEEVVATSGVGAVQESTVVLGGVLRTRHGEPLPAGHVRLDVLAETGVILADSGRVVVEHESTVVGVEVHHPERVVLSGPLDRHPTRTHCTQDGLGTATSCHAASQLAHMEVDSSIVSPKGGTLPGNGRARSEANVGRTISISGPTRGVVFVGRAQVGLVRITHERDVIWPDLSQRRAGMVVAVDTTTAIRDLQHGVTGVHGLAVDRLEPDLEPRVQPPRTVDVGVDATASLLAAPGSARVEVAAGLHEMVAYVFR